MDDAQSIDPEERGSLEEYYERLTPQERRERILLAPAYRDQYHAITQAHRTVTQPLYFWERWVPLLGPVAAVLYLKLRLHCFQGDRATAREDRCWPNQAELAEEIGLNTRQSIRDALRKLEALGFIRREPTYRRNEATGNPNRGTDAYCVFYELPLTTEDAIELLIRRSQESAPLHEEGNLPHGDRGPVHEEGIMPHYAGRNPSSLRWKESCQQVLKITSNVNVNVPDRNPSTSTNPLVLELVEELEDPSSLGFFRLLVRKVPEGLIRIALSETKAARLERRLEGRPGAYFTGAIKQLALNAGIEL